MSDTQLYFSVGVPSLIALVGILVNTSLFVHSRLFASENKSEIKFDLLIGKIGEMDFRFARLEDRMIHGDRN